MEIKIECPCGTHYAFEVEPMDGRMLSSVACPRCNADGTEAANTILAQTLNLAEPPADSKPRLTINRPKPTVPPPPPTPATAAASFPSELPSVRSTMKSVSKPASGAKVPAQSNTMMGFAATVAAGFLGMMIWYGLTKVTGYQIGIVAWGVGILTGYATRLFVPDGNFALGLVAATCAFVAILGGQYLVLRDEVDKVIGAMVSGSYEVRMDFARQAVKAQTDEEIRQLLEKESRGTLTKDDPALVTADGIQNFRKNELPELRQLIVGKPDQKEYEKRERAKISAVISKWQIMKSSVGLFTALWLFLGVGSAYKLASGEGDDT